MMKEKLKEILKEWSTTILLTVLAFYSVKNYFNDLERTETIQRVEVLRARQNGYLEGVADGVLGANDKKLIKVLKEKVPQPKK